MNDKVNIDRGERVENHEKWKNLPLAEAMQISKLQWKVYNVLVENKGNPVLKKFFLEKIDWLQEVYLRSTISKLRKEIDSFGYQIYTKITEGETHYRLDTLDETAHKKTKETPKTEIPETSDRVSARIVGIHDQSDILAEQNKILVNLDRNQIFLWRKKVELRTEKQQDFLLFLLVESDSDNYHSWKDLKKEVSVGTDNSFMGMADIINDILTTQYAWEIKIGIKKAYTEDEEWNRIRDCKKEWYRVEFDEKWQLEVFSDLDYEREIA